MTKEELAVFQPIMRIVTDAYLNISILNKHYIETISQLTGKDKDIIKKELNDLLPETKKKTEEFYKELVELYKTKKDIENL